MTVRCNAKARPLLRLFALTILLKTSLAMAQISSPDFSERLDTLWDYNKPAESEARFRAELGGNAAVAK